MKKTSKNKQVFNLPKKRIVVKKTLFFYLVKDEMSLEKGKIYFSRFNAMKAVNSLLGIKMH